jgi:hypothetical protein
MDYEICSIIRLIEYNKAYVIYTENNDIFICAKSEYCKNRNNSMPIQYKNVSKYLENEKDFVIWSYINDNNTNIDEEFPWYKGKLSANLYVLCIGN